MAPERKLFQDFLVHLPFMFLITGGSRCTPLPGKRHGRRVSGRNKWSSCDWFQPVFLTWVNLQRDQDQVLAQAVRSDGHGRTWASAFSKLSWVILVTGCETHWDGGLMAHFWRLCILLCEPSHNLCSWGKDRPIGQDQKCPGKAQSCTRKPSCRQKEKTIEGTWREKPFTFCTENTFA